MAAAHDAPVDIKGKAFVHPTAVLFNGGVFKATALKERILEVLNEWLKTDGGPAAKELAGADLDLAVARGAAYYGWVRHGHGVRIRGGTARSYYVGVESPAPAVPGFEPPIKGLCVAPFGMEEGTAQIFRRRSLDWLPANPPGFDSLLPRCGAMTKRDKCSTMPFSTKTGRISAHRDLARKRRQSPRPTCPSQSPGRGHRSRNPGTPLSGKTGKAPMEVRT